MRRLCLAAGAAFLLLGWAFAGSGFGMIGHMAGHMIAVAVAAPLLAFAIAGTPADPATRFPRIVTPLAMSVVELVVVWSWHVPALRLAAEAYPFVLIAEQASFLVAGLLLWSAALGAAGDARWARRAGGVAAMLLTSMHMTLLGALIGLAPRPLYAGLHAAHGMEPLADQQVGGVVMLMIGAAAYFFGGLAMLASLLRLREARS